MPRSTAAAAAAREQQQHAHEAAGSDNNGSSDEGQRRGGGQAQEPSTPRHTHHRGLPLKSPHARANAQSRVVYTPVAGRKFTRGVVDMAVTPKRKTLDPLRIGVSRTPFTAQRGIASYEAEKDPIRTYLRLKPAAAAAGGKQATSLVQMVGDKEVEMERAGDDGVRERYLFAGVLHSMSRQARVFEVCAVPVVRDLFAGYNTLLFSYGTTNSGKTYTVQGSSGSPGLLGRSLQAVLGVVDALGAQGDVAVRPRYATQVEHCSDPRVVRPTFRIAPGEDAWVSGLGDEDPLAQPQVRGIVDDLQRAQAAAGGGGAWVYQLYVSYVEVYNEMIYDLLDLSTLTTVHVTGADSEPAATAPRPATRRRGRAQTAAAAGEEAGDTLHMSAAQIAAAARTPLLLRSEGGRGNEAFVDGATEVRVRSVRDVVRVLLHGQLRRSVHATGLNAGSSRSHAVVQAKLVKLRRGADSHAAAAAASVRTLTIVDLAGSERAKRTGNRGDRLLEAGKINAGLMTLKKCLDVKRFNAALAPGDGAAQLVPYNESKVTRLLQPALEGGARTMMVVCVDAYDRHGGDDAAAHAEIKGVLDFARVASELVTCVRRVDDAAAGGGDDDGEDEVFFDTASQRASLAGAARKRGEAEAEAEAPAAAAATPKRQRTDLGGSWQQAPAPPPAPGPPPATPGEPRPARRANEPRAGLAARRAAKIPSAVWEALTRDSPFSFELAPERVLRDGPLLLSQAFAMHSEQRRELAYLRAALGRAQEHMRATRGQQGEVDELAAYAEALDASLQAVRAKYLAAQERVLRVEQETRDEVSAFFMAKLAALKDAAADRLADELVRSEAKAAHKIDILSRLRTARDGSDDDASDDEAQQAAALDAAQVPTVSPRSAIRRAVSRAASRKANKVASVSAGENRELARLRDALLARDAQLSSATTQLEMVAQARQADRASSAALEAALAEANVRAETLRAQLVRQASEHSAEAELAVTRAHESERAALLAQITMLKTRLRDADSQAMHARRRWEAHELVPVQERLRVLVDERSSQRRASSTAAAAAAAAADEGMDGGELLARAERERDDAWAWWTREQQRCSQLSAQNELLMREIRHLRSADPAALAQQLQLQQPLALALAQQGSATAASAVVSSEAVEVAIDSDAMDSDDSDLCIVSLKPADPAAATPSLPLLQPPPSLAVSSSQAALERVISKSRVLQRNLPSRAMSSQQLPLHHHQQHQQQQQHMLPVRDSSDSFGPLASASSAGAGNKLGGAKRVVSRVFNHFNHDASKRKGNAGDKNGPVVKPYLAGRFAATDTAVGSYSAEVFSFEQDPVQGSQQQQQQQQQMQQQSVGSGKGQVGRPRTNTVDSMEGAGARMRSIVYSGPIVSHKSGGVSVTFTSEEVSELPLVAEEEEEVEDEVETMQIDRDEDEMGEMDEMDDGEAAGAGGTKRTRSVMRRPGGASAAAIAVSTASAAAAATESSAASEANRSADSVNTGASSTPQPVAQHAASATDLTATVKKKRRLLQNRAMTDIALADYEEDDNDTSAHPIPASVAAPSSMLVGSWPPVSSPGAVRASPLVPQANKQPVLFTPVRTRSKMQTLEELSPPDAGAAEGDRQENIFLTPIKMLSRLRNRKK
ncbi:hypothetical protein LPJ53_004333 [Coemansia erecta]|uniref:Kinesin motor domain-containing protein n=1 Tax=Coemansia erecta TaxID=147472 RepID=A0A9W8CPX3_9FUNG|nr:hypothetical protein LPJ53_004333 [Coemansia erecta]